MQYHSRPEAGAPPIDAATAPYQPGRARPTAQWEEARLPRHAADLPDGELPDGAASAEDNSEAHHAALLHAHVLGEHAAQCLRDANLKGARASLQAALLTLRAPALKNQVLALVSAMLQLLQASWHQVRNPARVAGANTERARVLAYLYGLCCRAAEHQLQQWHGFLLRLVHCASIGALDDVPLRGSERALQQALTAQSEALARERSRAAALYQELLQHDGPGQPAPALDRRKAQCINRLAGGLAHEINNPLTGIMVMFDSVLDQRLPPERHRAYVCAMRAGLGRIGCIVGDLLRYAHPQPPRCTALRLRELLTTITADAQPSLKQKALRLHCTVEPEGIMALGDLTQLRVALGHILSNAAHAAPPGSQISIVCSQCEGRACVRIEDEGLGIPPEYVHQVCDPFFTTKRQGEGRGLGLAETYHILEAHKGEVRFANRTSQGITAPGHGTIVSVLLPLVQPSI